MLQEIQRHTDISFPASVPVGKTGKLRVQLIPAEEILPTEEVRKHPSTSPHDATKSLKALRPTRPEEQPLPIRLIITLAAENFKIEDARRVELIVPLVGKSPPIYFRLRGQKVGPGRIMVDFTQDGRPVGSVDLYPDVVGKAVPKASHILAWLVLPVAWSMAPSPKERPVNAGLIASGVDVALYYLLGSLFLLASCALLLVWRILRYSQNQPKARAEGAGYLSLNMNPRQQAPDVVIKVFELRLADQPGRLHFYLSSTHPKLQDLPVLDGDLGTQDLKSDVAVWVENQLRILGSLARRTDTVGSEVDKTLADVGYQMFDQLLPPKLQDLCWTFRARGVQTVLVLSDEPHIPWELIKPYRADQATGQFEKEDDCWGQAFAMTHWLRGRPPAQQLSLQRICAMAAGATCNSPVEAVKARDMVLQASETTGQPDSSKMPSQPDLLGADAELAVLRTLESNGATVQVLPAHRRSLAEAFERCDFDVLHLACHGSYGGTVAADSSGVLMEDGVFSAAELSPRLAGGVRSAAPLFFFNACHSGRLGFSLTRLGSWGARLVQLGCGAFVGALWPVTDQAALAFVQAFYPLVARGVPLGEAILQARLHVQAAYPNDPSWLAYCCFADPLATMVRPSSHPDGAAGDGEDLQLTKAG
jgi:hypothetical protein